MSVRVRKHKKGWLQVDVRVKLSDGSEYRERRKFGTDSKTAAKRWGEERHNFIVFNGPPSQREGAPTLREFKDRYIDEYAKANRQKPSTISLKNNILDHYLLPRFGDKSLDSITDAEVQKLKRELSSKKPKTVNNVLCVLNTLLKVAVEWGVLEAMPAKIKLLRVPRPEVAFYEPHEYERLVQAAKDLGDHRLLVFVLLGGDAGLRCGEMLALEQTDEDLKRGVLHVRQSEWEGHVTVPKSGHGRTVVLTDRLADALSKNRHLRCDRVLWRDDGHEKVTQVLLAKWMRRLQRKAGLKVTGSLKILRHTFCSRLAMAGASTMAIKELAGHQEISTTQRYMHLSPAAKSVAIALLDNGADLAASESKDEAKKGQRAGNASASPAHSVVTSTS